MRRYGSQTGWLKMVALACVALGIAACSSFDPDSEDAYVPVAHYERHPIIVTKSGAHAQDCGSWPNDLTDTSHNEPYENFGCAQQNNIAAMVADPEDLLRPRRQTPSDAARRSKIFDNYRQGEATAAAQEQRQKVEISNVGSGGGSQ